MTQKDKQLLLKDLCARLPYGVKLRYVEDLVVKKESHIITLNNIYLEHILNGDADIKPYLRSMSSMTEEEKSTYLSYCECDDGDFTGEILYFNTIESFDYLNQIHIDYRNLIPRGLAIEAPEGMYKTN